MKLKLLRNATVELHTEAGVLLVDPFLGDAGAYPPIANTAGDERNPLVDLPEPAADIVARADAVLLTHLHNDHFDPAAMDLLDPAVPLFCGPQHVPEGFTNVTVVESEAAFGSLTLTRVRARHAVDENEEPLGPVNGFVIDGVHITGDCVWCPELEEELATHEPRVVILNSGGARFLRGGPISMTPEQVIEVARRVPRVVAVHLEALNHCPVTRDELHRHLVAAGVRDRVDIPADGETLEL